MKRIGLTFLALLVLAAAYLLLWPTDVDPMAWQPPTAKAWATNDKLAGGELRHPELVGAEAVAFDTQGRAVTGLKDGRVVRLEADGSVSELGNTGGRPLGLSYDAAGGLVVADAVKGLVRLPPGGETFELLASTHEGKPILFADDLAIAKDGTIYFSDVSDRWNEARHEMDILEHRPRGRVLAYHPADKKTTLVAAGLYFANGVALGPDDAYLLVNETASYRVTRVWLSGEKRGQVEPFVDNLPGFPDNVTYSPTRRAFWVAIVAPRDKNLDALAGRPFLRKMIARLPRALQPAAKRHGWALAFDESGQLVADLQDPRKTSFSPVTSVREHDGKLYLGSFWAGGVYVVNAP